MVAVEGEFDDVGVGDEFWIMEWAAGGDHGESVVLAKGAGEGVDKGGVQKGLVSLNVNDVSGGLALGGGFRDAVGAGGVVTTGVNGTCADTFAEGGDAFVIGCDDELIDILTERSTLEDVLEEGFTEEGVKGLSGEAGRSPAGWDDPNDACFFVVYIYPP